MAWNIKTGKVETRCVRRVFKDSEVLQDSVLAVADNNEYRRQLVLCGGIEALDRILERAVANYCDHRPLDSLGLDSQGDTHGSGSSPAKAAAGERII